MALNGTMGTAFQLIINKNFQKFPKAAKNRGNKQLF